MFWTAPQAIRLAEFAKSADRIDVRKPTFLDALPEGYIVANVWYSESGTFIEYGIDRDGRASS